MSTPPNSMYQKAVVTFTDPDVVKRWETMSFSWCKCQCLRVAPAYHSKQDHDSRFQFTAVLRNIPFGLDEMDLANILKDTCAAAMNLPRNSKTYNNKPWCYFFFKTQEALDAATEMKFSLRKRELEWCGPDDVKKLCPRCSSLAHAAKDCDAFNSRGRGRSNIPKSLLNNYERFKPAGYKSISSTNNNNRNRNRSNSRSHSRSRSNSRSSRPSSNQNNKN